MYAMDTSEISMPAKFMTTQNEGNRLKLFPSNTYFTKFCVESAEVHNRSGVSATCGFGGVLPLALWGAGQWDESDYVAGTVMDEDTTDAQDDGTNDFVLDVVGTNNDGFVIYSDVPFNIVSVIVGQASSAATVWAAYYSKPSTSTGFSSNYGTFSNMLVAPSFGTTGEKLIWFTPPSDWVKTSSTTAVVNRHGLGIPADKYVLVVKSTTAPNSTAGLASKIVVGRMVYSTEAIPDNGVLSIVAPFELPSYLESMAAAISDVTAVNSRATATYRLG